jgi:hypothetical protein
VTYPHPDVASYIEANFISVRVYINNREDWHLFRAYHVIWTPTIAFMDRNGGLQHQSAGYLPAPEFLSTLRIGKARCLMAWTRLREAAHELETAAGSGDSLAPEALYWLGIARYLERRETTGMWQAWERLQAQYPDSPWAKRIYPRDQGSGIGDQEFTNKTDP